jgi:mono/diheme cytochrome c family protein
MPSKIPGVNDLSTNAGTDRRSPWPGIAVLILIGLVVAFVLTSCRTTRLTGPNPQPLDPALVVQGKTVFRFDTYGDESFWTDSLRLHEVIRSGVSPKTALSVGLKVDLDTLPAAVRSALQAGQVNLDDPATTVTLLKLGAVVGVIGSVDASNNLTSVGITCALCHSTVDNAFAPGIGHRLDGWPNHDLNVGAIVALSPALPASAKTVFSSWGPGKYDPRFNLDGQNMPVVIPAAFGLRNVAKEIYTGDDTISYWNRYVAVTQMHGHGSFTDTRIAVNVQNPPERVTTAKLAALRAYQFSLATPTPPTGLDAAAVARGRTVFTGAGQCATCHVGNTFTDIDNGKLHTAAEVGQSAAYAQRSATKLYRTTPLRALFHPPQLQGPYFHDGSAKTLEDVVNHYVTVRHLNLTEQQRADLVQYLKSL